MGIPRIPTTFAMTLTQRLLFGGSGGSDSLSDLGLLILRLFAGLALALAHGMGKIPPSGFAEWMSASGVPMIFVWLCIIAEFGGGIFLALGLLTRPAAFLIVGNMVSALLIAHRGQSFGEMELPLFFLATAVCFVLVGAGRYSVDNMIRSRLSASTVTRFVRS